MRRFLLPALLLVLLCGNNGRAQVPSFTFLVVGSLGGQGTHITAINRNGDVVGGSMTSAGTEHAFLWKLTTPQLVDLGTFGGDTSVANGINDVGQIVGRADDLIGHVHAFVYDHNQG